MQHVDLGIDGLLLNVLSGVPRLDGALCIGRADLFDPKAEHEDRLTVAERHDRARAVCAGCPALDACTEWAQDQPLDGQVLAGTVMRPGRRREAAA